MKVKKYIEIPEEILVALAEVFGYGTGYYVGYALITVMGVFLCYGIYYLIKAITCREN